MLKPFLKLSRRTLVILLETLCVLILLAGAGIGVLVWQLSQGPVSIGWARDYVEEALSNQDEDLSVKFDDMVISWPDMSGRVQLELSGLNVRRGEQAASSLSIDRASVGLSRRALMFGLIRPVSVVIRSPSLELLRTREGKLSLFFDRQERPEPEAAPEQDGGQQRAGEEVAQLFRDMANHERGKILSRLDRFEIENASVAVRDYRYGLSWYLTDLGFVMKEHPQGVSASVRAPLPGGRKESADIALDLVYRKESDDFRAAGKIRDVNPYILSRFLPVPEVLGGQDLYFTGDVEAALNNDLMPTYLKIAGSVPEGAINLPEEFDAPIALKDIRLESEYSDAENRLSINRFSGEVGGIAFEGSGEAEVTDDAISLPVTVTVAKADLAQVPPMFPKSEQDGQAYKWLARNIQGGSFSNVRLDMRLEAGRSRDEEMQRDVWDVDMPDFRLGFDFEGASVDYHDTLMKAENASGSGMLDLGTEVLEITNAKASIGEIQGSNVSVKVTDLMTSGGGYVTVTADLDGPMATALSYIALPPISMDKERIGLDAESVRGRISAAIEVGLPTIKDLPKDAVKVAIKGELSELSVPEIVKGLTLSGGPLALQTEPGGFRIKGDAQLAGRDVSLDWHQYFESAGNPYSMRIRASAGADQELRDHFNVDLDDYISGTMPVEVVYTSEGGGAADVDVEGDLNPVRVHIAPFKFEKPVGTPGRIKATAHLKNDTLKELTGIEIKSRDFSVKKARIGFVPRDGKSAEIDNGELSGAVIGKTEADVSFDTKKGVLQIKADAGVFDLAPFLEGTEASDMYSHAPRREQRQPMDITLRAGRMLLKNGQEADAVKTFVALDNEGDITQLEYDAKLGEADMLVRFRPDESGKRSFRLQTNDAGQALHAFGLYENVRGGDLIIYGEPKGENGRGDLYGSMRMENFRVVRAPALASLLSLMSLSGVGQLLNNEGLVFSKLESGFEWRFRPEGNLLIIKDGKTSGNSIGLTFSGVLDRGRKTTDIAGTIIPITGVNTFLAKVPLVGEILGGASGLIAATYSMKGPTSDPRVAVNPLSVLAPGIIRRILFEDGYEGKIPDEGAAAPPADGASSPGDREARYTPNKSDRTVREP